MSNEQPAPTDPRDVQLCKDGGLESVRRARALLADTLETAVPADATTFSLVQMAEMMQWVVASMRTRLKGWDSLAAAAAKSQDMELRTISQALDFAADSLRKENVTATTSRIVQRAAEMYRKADADAASCEALRADVIRARGELAFACDHETKEHMSLTEIASIARAKNARLRVQALGFGNGETLDRLVKDRMRELERRALEAEEKVAIMVRYLGDRS